MMTMGEENFAILERSPLFVFLERSEGTVKRYLGFGKHAKRSSYSRSFVGLVSSSKMTMGKYVFLERSEGTVTCYLDQCETRKPWFTFQIFRRAMRSSKITKNEQKPFKKLTSRMECSWSHKKTF
jgi:hypothetical protein